ncbi:MAG: hypothetical protein DWQ01_11815 [Planctomycetota bacterium]|nr:MAG: hypothetical protein DWQ01_11815 [Planctomycetota bacterium]
MHFNSGPLAETWFADYLEARGWKLLQRNLRTPYGEIDILAISRRPSRLVAVEVKARSSFAWLPAEESLRPGQLRRLREALQWIAQEKKWNGALSVDLAVIHLVPGAEPELVAFGPVDDGFDRLL